MDNVRIHRLTTCFQHSGFWTIYFRFLLLTVVSIKMFLICKIQINFHASIHRWLVEKMACTYCCMVYICHWLKALRSTPIWSHLWYDCTLICTTFLFLLIKNDDKIMNRSYMIMHIWEADHTGCSINVRLRLKESERRRCKKRLIQ